MGCDIVSDFVVSWDVLIGFIGSSGPFFAKRLMLLGGRKSLFVAEQGFGSRALLETRGSISDTRTGRNAP